MKFTLVDETFRLHQLRNILHRRINASEQTAACPQLTPIQLYRIQLKLRVKPSQLDQEIKHLPKILLLEKSITTR